MYGYIYLTTNLVNQRKYIGQHKSSKFNKKYLGSGLIIKQAVELYGKENFKVELLEWCDSKESLDEAEIRIIKERNAVYSEEYYNIAYGGGARHGPLTEEQRKNLSYHAKQRTGEKNPFFGKRHSEETRQKITHGLEKYYETHTATNYGKICITNGITSHYISEGDEIPDGFWRGMTEAYPTEEHLENLRKRAKERVYTDEDRLKMSLAQKKYLETHDNSFKGKHHTEESKRKLSESHKKENLSDETRRKMSVSQSLHNIGRVWVNNGKENKFVKEIELQKYIELGYQNGRLVKFQEGTVWINNGICNTRIHKGEEVPEGWTLGLLRKR